MLEFELDFLNNSLWHYTYKRQSNWVREFRLYQLEQIRDRIPEVIKSIKEIKSEIWTEKSKIYGDRQYNQKNNEDTYNNLGLDDYFYEEYDNYDDYNSYTVNEYNDDSE
jgi:hypothetical protein